MSTLKKLGLLVIAIAGVLSLILAFGSFRYRQGKAETEKVLNERIEALQSQLTNRDKVIEELNDYTAQEKERAEHEKETQQHIEQIISKPVYNTPCLDINGLSYLNKTIKSLNNPRNSKK